MCIFATRLTFPATLRSMGQPLPRRERNSFKGSTTISADVICFLGLVLGEFRGASQQQRQPWAIAAAAAGGGTMI